MQYHHIAQWQQTLDHLRMSNPNLMIHAHGYFPSLHETGNDTGRSINVSLCLPTLNPFLYLTLLHRKVLLVSPGMAAAKPFSQGV